ncbi:MAG: glycosyltransferase [Chloroflexota bacterium]|nr:glycosyltransferase [Chloroflexota bacterium]
MRILFAASLHHPEALRAAIAATTPGEPVPLFPPSMAQHFYERAFRKRGHVLDVFYRNNPGRQTPRHREGITPGKLIAGALNRIPPELNPSIQAINRAFIAKARAFQPDIVWMVGDNTTLTPDALIEVKGATGAALVYACGTSPIVFSHRIDRAAARLYDLVITSDYYHGVQWLELGAARMECLPLSACDPDFHKPYVLTDDERAAHGCDIAFVGTLVPDHLYSRRVRALEALRDFDLGIWSVHDVPESLRSFVRGAALGESMQRILSAAKICINTHGDFVHYGGNLRLFEVAGANVFQLVDDLPGVRAWFPDHDGTPMLLAYRDADDLHAKVRHYLDHADQRVAAASRAQTHVYRHHTYENRVERLETLFAEVHKVKKVRY